MVRLRRVSCSGPGIRRVRERQGLPVRRRRRRPGARTGCAAAHLGARPAARVGGRVDLRGPERARPGDRRRRQGPPPVPVPRRLARPARPGQARPRPGLRGAAARGARAHPRRPDQQRPADPHPRAGLRRPAARPRLLPHRRRAVRHREPVVRPGDAAQGARRASPATGEVVLRVHRQERQALAALARRARGVRRRRRAQAPSRRRARAARLPRPAARWVDVKSSDINAYLREATGGDDTAKDFRTWSATVLAAIGLAVSTHAEGPPPATAPSRAS